MVNTPFRKVTATRLCLNQHPVEQKFANHYFLATVAFDVSDTPGLSFTHKFVSN